MKSINFFLVIAALFLTSNLSFAQSSKDNKKAIKSTDKIDNQLKSENPALALSESQREQIIALQMEYIDGRSNYRKNDSNKDEAKAKSKELKKAMTAKINEEIFTPEQAIAYKGSMKSKLKKPKTPKTPVETITEAEADNINASATDKQKAKAEKATEELNESIIASDANLALSPDQKKQINILNLKRLIERSKMTEAGVAKDEIKIKSKELNKSNKQIIKSILTKEQNAAVKASKGKKKK